MPQFVKYAAFLNPLKGTGGNGGVIPNGSVGLGGGPVFDKVWVGGRETLVVFPKGILVAGKATLVEVLPNGVLVVTIILEADVNVVVAVPLRQGGSCSVPDA